MTDSSPSEPGRALFAHRDPSPLYPVEHADHYEVPLGDCFVNCVHVDHAFSFTFSMCAETADGTEVHGSHSLRIEAPFTVEGELGAGAYDPEADIVGLGPLLALHSKTPTRLLLFKDGTLELTFAEGGVLTVPPDARFESFSLAASIGRGSYKWDAVGLPGGGISI